MNKYETKDINLSSYLVFKGLRPSISFQGKEAFFAFEANDIQTTIKKFYSDEEGFLQYSNTLRNLKSQIHNLRKGVE